MPRGVKKDDQLGMDETVIDDEVVADALEEYEDAADAAVSYNKAKKTAKQRAMTAIERLEIPPDGAVRVGRHRIVRKITPARDVEFHVDEKDQIKFKLADKKAGRPAGGIVVKAGEGANATPLAESPSLDDAITGPGPEDTAAEENAVARLERMGAARRKGKDVIPGTNVSQIPRANW